MRNDGRHTSFAAIAVASSVSVTEEVLTTEAAVSGKVLTEFSACCSIEG